MSQVALKFSPGIRSGHTAVNFLQAHFLVATDQLRDPNFFHTIVLLVRHSEEGALGLVLNRPTTARIDKVWSEVSDSPCSSREPLHLGGPCEGLLMALHTRPAAADLEVMPGVYYSGDPDYLRELVTVTDSPVRFFVGYAGWSAGQLETELREGSWAIAQASAEQVFNVDELSWERLIKQIVTSDMLSALGIKHVPKDPSLN